MPASVNTSIVSHKMALSMHSNTGESAGTKG